MPWPPLSLQDHLAASAAPDAPVPPAAMHLGARAPTVPDAAPVAPPVGSPLVRCACGRVTNADLFLDVRGLPDAMRAQLRWHLDDAAPLPAFVCDACREGAIRRGRVTRADLYAALGAPPDVVARFRAGA